MQPEGMVHALKEIHRLLAPGGCLIDIHPAPVPTLIEVHHCGAVLFSTEVPGETFEGTRSAEDALAQVVKEGLFGMEQVSQVDWRTYASSVAELREYMVWESGYREEPLPELTALRDGELAERLQGFLQAAGEGAQVARLYSVRIARLDPVRP
jgi:hypothetical protein